MGPLDLLPAAPPDRFGREPDLNAFVELHNLIAAAESPMDFGPADADRISRERGIDLRRAFHAERLGVYVALIDEALAAGGLDARSQRRLAAAAETLALTTAELVAVHERAFGQAVSGVLADDCLSVGERLHLYGLQTALGLDPARAEAAYRAPARERLMRVVARVLCDGELPPEQAAEVASAAEALAVSIDPALAAMLNAAASRWEARSAPLPRLAASPIALRSGETVHADLSVRWAQKRSDELQDALADGLSRAPTRHQRFPWHRFMAAPRAGRLVLTDQRLVVADAARAPASVPLGRIREVAAFADSLVVQVDGASPRWVLKTGDETPAVSALLERAAEAAGGITPPEGAAAWWRPLVDGEVPRRLAEAPFGWSLPGTVRAAGSRIELHGLTGEVHIGMARVERLARSGSAVAIDLDGLAGWIVYFREHADSAAFYERIAQQIERRGAR